MGNQEGFETEVNHDDTQKLLMEKQGASVTDVNPIGLQKLLLMGNQEESATEVNHDAFPKLLMET